MSCGSQSDLVVLWLDISAELTYAGPSQIPHVKRCTKAAYIGNNECVKKGVEAGLFQVMFWSSESLLIRSRWHVDKLLLIESGCV